MEPLRDGVTVAEVTRKDGITVPAIWAGGEAGVQILAEPLCLAFWLVSLKRPYAQVESVTKSIGRLLCYYIHRGRPLLDERGLRKLVQDYFLLRSEGDPDLGWAPQSWLALEAELRHIEQFSDFCEREFGHLSLLGRCVVTLPRPQEAASFWQLMASNEKDFFSHLAARRRRKGHLIAIPGRKGKRSGARSASGMNAEFAWRLIEAERNPTYRALWLLGFFGGPRISESANLWVCDVLPGLWRKHWFPGDIFHDLPLVVIANPWTSKWCGDLHNQTAERQTFLLEKYGLRPRPELKENDAGELRGKFAGFKGTRNTNYDCDMRQIFWADESAADLFGTTILEVLQSRNRLPRARTHPYLFVNTDCRKPQVLGDMLSISNANKAFARAVRRVGGVPHRFMQSPHGMRHLYKDLISRLLGGDAGAIQICMGHRSRESQDVYGTLNMEAMRHTMASTRRCRNPLP